VILAADPMPPEVLTFVQRSQFILADTSQARRGIPIQTCEGCGGGS
jgi:hypothetical protein